MSPLNHSTRSASHHSSLHEQDRRQQQQFYSSNSRLANYSPSRYHSGSLSNLFGSNFDFEIEIEKRPPLQPEQPTIVSLDQNSRAIVTTSKDGRVSIQNVAAQPGNTVVINSDFHSSDRSLNRSSGYFSSDEYPYQDRYTNYSSDEQISSSNQNYPQIISHARNYQTISNLPSTYHPTQTYRFGRVNQLVDNYSQSLNNTNDFHKTINQIDALYNNLDVQTNKYSKPISRKNRRKELSRNADEYSARYTSTGFQQVSYEQQKIDNNQQNRTSLNDLITNMPIEPLASSRMSANNVTTNSMNPNASFASTQDVIVHQNRLNERSQIVQRNRTSAKQKNEVKRRNKFTRG